jgi:hypothetical protein
MRLMRLMCLMCRPTELPLRRLGPRAVFPAPALRARPRAVLPAPALRARPRAVPTVLLLIAMVLGGGRPAGWTGGPPATVLRFPGPAHGPYLVISGQHLRDIQAVAPRLAAKLLARRTTIVLAPGSPALTRPDAAVGTAFFTSYSEFIARLRRHAIPRGVRAVAYDPELWRATPFAERLDPERYMALFAGAAHSHGYAAILMPGRDLLAAARSCRQQPGEDLDAAFLRCGLAGKGARLSQVFAIQTAPVELSTTELRGFAAACAKQARAANPSVVLIATLSTQPGTGWADGWQLARAAAAVRPYVQGFQLNLTPRSARAAVSFLLRTFPALRG